MVTRPETAGAPGDVALAFANFGEALAAPAALVEWLAGRRLLDEAVLASLGSPEIRRLHSEGIRLHGAVLGLLDRLAGEQPLDAATCFEIDRFLEAATWQRRFEREQEGASCSIRIRESLSPSTLPGILAPIALAAAELAQSAPGGRLRTCAAADCARWFLDTSKGGRRRWCSMATCGNRAKAARWRERHASGV